MKTLTCKLCNKDMGEIEKGKFRITLVVLCEHCWTRANAAINIVETSVKDKPNTDSMPDFMKEFFGGFKTKL